MTRTTRALGLVVAGFVGAAASFAGGCRCKPKPKAKPRISPPAKARKRRPKPKRMLAREQRAAWKRIMHSTEELRRRVANDFPLRPARTILYWAKKIDVSNRPAGYVRKLGEMNKLAAALEKSTHRVMDFNGLVASCIGCHRKHSPKEVAQLEALMVKPSEVRAARKGRLKARRRKQRSGRTSGKE